MKFIFTLALLLVGAIESYGQIIFDKGYFIDNDGQRNECLIWNKDWKNNPSEITYKTSTEAPTVTIDITKMKEFGIYGYCRYIRANVKIDRSLQITGWLTTEMNPKWFDEQLFLKVLLRGNASLFAYEGDHQYSLFYSIDTSAIKQLIFKEFLVSDLIAANVTFRRQLERDLKCDTKTSTPYQEIKYTPNDLVRYFKNYNSCIGDTSEVFDTKPQRKSINIRLTPGRDYNKLTVFLDDKKEVEFGKQKGFRLGIEVEAILPFRNGRLALVVEPTYHQMEKDMVYLKVPRHISYKTIELPLGVRFYALNYSNVKLYVNGFYHANIGTDFNSKVKVNDKEILDINTSGSFSIGMGAQYKRIGAEMRMNSNIQLFYNYMMWTSEFKRVSAVFSYKLY